ncbi:uncharacterized protein [Onthophagus taurus]|uniref:uncharacterized protein n=1 Tax=Onthophagus taurus TaxID=166361 RepID=UPI0039BDE795
MFLFLAFVINVFYSGNCIISGKIKNDPINLIWDLTSYAVKSRQLENNYVPMIPLGNPQNILEAMFSIAQNDDHLCVPKLLCEITSGTLSYGRQSFLPQFNMESILEALSSFETISPIILFGRAALLGYNSKGDSYSCAQAYPKCPRDPDLLLNYLNNHNGGFFRFFNGLPQQHQNDIVGFNGYHYGFFPQKGKHVGRNLIFPNNEITENSLDIQKPLPNHIPSRTIFPIRTGTGSLVIDDYENDRNSGFVKFV